MADRRRGRRGGEGYADHRQGSSVGHHQSPYQRPWSRGSSSSGRGDRGRDFSHGFDQGAGHSRARIGDQKPTLCCNFARLESLDRDRLIWEYEVSFEPEVSDRMRKSYLANKHFHTVTNSALKVYDQGSLIWSPIKTENEVYESTYELRDGQKVQVSLKKKCQKNISLQILNVIFKRLMSETELVKIRRAYFNPNKRHLSPEHNLEVWPGFEIVVDEYEGGIFVNIDVSFKVLQNQTVYAILSEIMRNGDTQAFREQAQNCLLGQSIITRYNNRTVRIDDIDFNATPSSLFERKGEKISYADYYKSQYNIKILDLHQPMLVSRLKKRGAANQQDAEEDLNYYVPELCHPTGLAESQKMNFTLMRTIAGITQLDPEHRNREITQFLQTVNENGKCRKLLEDWGLKIPNQTISLQARIIEPVKITVGNSRTIEEPSADFGRALSREKVLHGVPLEEWAIVYTARDERTVNMFSRKIVEVAQRIGIKATMPRYRMKLENDRPEEYCRVLRSLPKVELVMIVFPSRRNDRYITVKRLCHEMNIPSQVINLKTISNLARIDGIATKIVMQVNCKIGGSLWTVNIPKEEEDGLMVCGLYMRHESGRIRPAEGNCIALVATLDSVRWTSNTVQVSPGQNMIDEMCALFELCLNDWCQVNGKPPKRVIVYRVGIGDNQLSTVQNVEIARLKQVFSRTQSTITYIVVQSRNNTRFYEQGSNGVRNPPPGTILDHTITKKDMTNFYLVSPTVRVGTVTPTHYIVIENSSSISTQIIESITFKLTHMYYNWTAGIRVPAPCQYAERLAQQADLRIKPPTSQNMRNTLFFL